MHNVRGNTNIRTITYDISLLQALFVAIRFATGFITSPLPNDSLTSSVALLISTYDRLLIMTNGGLYALYL